MSMRAHQLDNLRRRKEELWRHRNLGAMPHSARFVGNLYKVSYFDATCDAHTSPNESPRRSASTSESRSESWAKSTSHTRSESKAESGSESSDDTPNVTNVTIRRRRRPVAIPWRHVSRCGVVACVLMLVVALGLVGLADAGDVGDGGAGANGQASGSLGAAFGVGVAVVARSAGAYDQPAAETQNLAAALVAGHASVSSANAPVGAAVQRGRSNAAAAAALLLYLQSEGQSDNLVTVDMLLSESGGAAAESDVIRAVAQRCKLALDWHLANTAVLEHAKKHQHTAGRPNSERMAAKARLETRRHNTAQALKENINGFRVVDRSAISDTDLVGNASTHLRDHALPPRRAGVDAATAAHLSTNAAAAGGL